VAAGRSKKRLIIINIHPDRLRSHTQTNKKMKTRGTVSLMFGAAALAASGLNTQNYFVDDFNRANTSAGDLGAGWAVSGGILYKHECGQDPDIRRELRAL